MSSINKGRRGRALLTKSLSSDNLTGGVQNGFESGIAPLD
jgi:hypothetical protein